jgi:FimV-like protein
MKKVIVVLCMALCCVAVGANAANTGSYGPVVANETLYRIALKHRQPGVTVSQMMMGIFEANPDAFSAGNINRLKIGETLQIPDLQGALRASRKQAYEDATAQIGAYEAEAGKAKVGPGEQATPGQSPPDPERVSAAPLAAAVSLPDAAQITEMKVGLAADQQQLAQGSLPEPKPAPRQRQKKSSDPVFRYSYDIAFIDDDNLRLAQEDEDIRADRSLSATVRARGGTSLDKFSILNYGASGTYNKFDAFDTLDNYEVEANVRYRFALTSSFTSPIYSLGARIGGREFDTEMRDATFVVLSADLNKWITNTINMTTGVGLNAQESKSEVFDTSEARIFINFDTNFSKTDLVYTTFTYITGDTVASATPSLDIINVADAIEADDAFGGIAANQFAYRFKADTVVLTLGYNRIFTPDLSLDVSARFVESEAQDDGDITYERTIFRASLLGRF